MTDLNKFRRELQTIYDRGVQMGDLVIVSNERFLRLIKLFDDEIGRQLKGNYTPDEQATIDAVKRALAQTKGATQGSFTDDIPADEGTVNDSSSDSNVANSSGLADDTASFPDDFTSTSSSDATDDNENHSDVETPNGVYDEEEDPFLSSADAETPNDDRGQIPDDSETPDDENSALDDRDAPDDDAESESSDQGDDHDQSDDPSDYEDDDEDDDDEDLDEDDDDSDDDDDESSDDEDDSDTDHPDASDDNDNDDDDDEGLEDDDFDDLNSLDKSYTDQSKDKTAADVVRETMSSGDDEFDPDDGIEDPLPQSVTPPANSSSDENTNPASSTVPSAESQTPTSSSADDNDGDDGEPKPRFGV